MASEFKSRCLISARDPTFQKFIADGIFATLHVLGCFSMILTGPVLDKFGASVVHCLSLVLTVSGHAVLWQLTMHHDTEALPYILYVAAYIAGKAFCYGYSGVNSTWEGLSIRLAISLLTRISIF